MDEEMGKPPSGELAKRIGTNKSYISRIEKGITVPNVVTFYRILYHETYIISTCKSLFYDKSGFIIAYNYQKKSSENKITKRAFRVARIARIYPLHWLTLFIAVTLGNITK